MAIGSTHISALLEVLWIHGVVSGFVRSIHENGILQCSHQHVSHSTVVHFASAHRFRNGQISVRRCWYCRMWIDLEEALALVSSSKIIDVILVVIRFHLV
jgi:hypothetical protein